MTDIALVRVTFDAAAEADRIARHAIDERLAACVNIAPPCASIFRWRDVVETADEVTAIFKTTIALASRSEEHTSELQSLMRISYAVFCLTKKTKSQIHIPYPNH